ncbi:MAG: LCP family protein [Lachnospiraceae bacterium]|nr:LCP family protein [Lachnospiraceae bacterium]
MSERDGRRVSRSSKKRARKRRRIALFVIEMLVLAGVLIGLLVVLKLDKADTGNKESVIKATVNEEVQEQIEAEDNTWKMSGYKNIALFGVDSRDNNLDKGARTDTIMVASLNNETGDIKICSIFRDTYLNVGNDTYNKANQAYAKGGPEQAIQMLNSNLDMDITDYITVNFEALVDIIDDVGGVEIDVTEEEISFLNDYQIGTAEVTGDTIINVTKPGLQTLNGLQATSYCRIRYTKGDDFKRAERQRNVLTQVANKAKKADIATLNDIIDDILPKIKTSMSKADFVEYASRAATFNIAETSGFPFDRITGNMGKAGSSVVANDFANNVVLFHQFLFGDSEYTPSATVLEISDKIAADRTKNGL